ncbi:hypothetical protein KZP23_06535 [Echinicola marina]|nr:hypothetical protein [Echinicola marina]UCS94665.1 hypothetical protein KZP23_06535 [Echinicola marina]
MKKSKKKYNIPEVPLEERDYTEGFGGIPEDIKLTKNLGCGSNSKSKKDD